MKLDMSQIIDGYAGNEHALTAVPLYADMLALVAKSGVGWTATLQITNGGPEGQDYFIVRDHPAQDAKLNRFAPRFVVDMKTRVRTYREPDEYLFPRVAASVAAVQRAGGLIGIGAHGEMPGLGFHWELQAHTMGGMTPAEALRAGTIGSAAAIGRAVDFGSLEPGKYADLVILERNPLTDIANTLAIAAVMEGGRLRDGATLTELWPEQRPLPRRWYCDDRPPGTSDPCSSRE
jgi:Amidohydrolase family